MSFLAIFIIKDTLFKNIFWKWIKNALPTSVGCYLEQYYSSRKHQGNNQVTPIFIYNDRVGNSNQKGNFFRGVTWRLPSVTWLTVYSVILSSSWSKVFWLLLHLFQLSRTGRILISLKFHILPKGPLLQPDQNYSCASWNG